jgi:putative salt-induced outer membrane protein
MKITLLTAITAALFIGHTASAEESLTRTWSGSASLGGFVTSGNTENSSTTGAITLAKRSDNWTHNLTGSVYTAEENDVETAERTELAYRIDRYISDSTFGFARVGYDTDDFANIDERTSILLGVGRTFFDTDKRTFSASLGVGTQSTDLISLDADGDGANELDSLSNDDTVYYLGLNYRNRLRENVSFNSVLSVEFSDLNTLSIWDNSLNLSVSDRFTIAFGVLTRDNSDIVGVRGKNTDSSTTLRLIYGI